MSNLAARVRELVDRRGEVHNRDIVAAFRVSAATAHRVLHALVAGGTLQRIGKGPAARYRLPTIYPYRYGDRIRVFLLHRICPLLARSVDVGMSAVTESFGG